MNLDPKDAGWGLYEKYAVSRRDGRDLPGQPHEHCSLFVLDLSHDPHAINAARAYAHSCQDVLPRLASDLIDKAKDLHRRLGLPGDLPEGVSCEPIVSREGLKPFVKLLWGGTAAILDCEGALELANQLTSCAHAAGYDAALSRFWKQDSRLEGEALQQRIALFHDVLERLGEEMSQERAQGTEGV